MSLNFQFMFKWKFKDLLDIFKIQGLIKYKIESLDLYRITFVFYF